LQSNKAALFAGRLFYIHNDETLDCVMKRGSPQAVKQRQKAFAFPANTHMLPVMI